jgi:hypothetical protein
MLAGSSSAQLIVTPGDDELAERGDALGVLHKVGGQLVVPHKTASGILTVERDALTGLVGSVRAVQRIDGESTFLEPLWHSSSP